MSNDQTQNRNQSNYHHPYYDVRRQDKTNNNVYQPVSSQPSFSNSTYQQSSSFSQNNHKHCVLENSGNVCFLNSIIHCLYNIPELVEYYRNYRQQFSSNGNNSVSKVFADLVNKMQWQSSARTNELKLALCQYAPHFHGYHQQDAHECLTVILDALHQETSKKMNDDDEKSIITDLFQGQMKYIIRCSEVLRCRNVTDVIDPFFDIPVFVENTKNDALSSSSSTTFIARFFLIDGHEKISTITRTESSTIQSVINNLRQQCFTQINRTTIVAMRISSDNTLVGQYRSTVLLSQIDDQSVVFYEIDTTNRNPKIICLFLDKNRKTLNQLYNRPPLLLNIPNQNFVDKLRICLHNHFNTYNAIYDIGEEDPSIDMTPTFLSSNTKTFIVKFDETAISSNKTQLTQSTTYSQQNASVTLEQCLEKNILSIERMSSNNNTWFCSKCDQNRQATKQNSIISLPRVLIVHLKRFNIESTQCRSKIETFVKYPLELNMVKYLSNQTNQESIYDLMSVCLHTGSFESGHYITYAKKSTGWFRFSDFSVDPISNNEIVSKNAYILFYLKRSK